jgi:cytochrome b
MTQRNERLVWDLPVRLVHWLIVLAVAGSWATHYAGIEWFAWHRRLGYAALLLVVFRVAWGFVGTRHARFGSFLRGPREILDYLRGRTAEGHVGHNPLGGARRRGAARGCCSCRPRRACSPTTRS